MNQPVDESLPGFGQFYCVQCARYFTDQNSLGAHIKTKVIPLIFRFIKKHSREYKLNHTPLKKLKKYNIDFLIYIIYSLIFIILFDTPKLPFTCIYHNLNKLHDTSLHTINILPKLKILKFLL
jgi:hypothetical protein